MTKITRATREKLARRPILVSCASAPFIPRVGTPVLRSVGTSPDSRMRGSRVGTVAPTVLAEAAMLRSAERRRSRDSLASASPPGAAPHTTIGHRPTAGPGRGAQLEHTCLSSRRGGRVVSFLRPTGAVRASAAQVVLLIAATTVASAQTAPPAGPLERQVLAVTPPPLGDGTVACAPRATTTWDAFGPGPAACQEAEPLPVLDDFGVPITLEEIEARMRSGAGAAVLGGLLGGGLGLALGAVIAFDQCGLWERCSPREEAIGGVAILAGLAWGAALGSMGARGAREVDRWEALELIRAERRLASEGQR